MSAYDELLAHIVDLEIIDTHEHLPGHESWRPARNDVLAEWLTHYFSCDLVSAGLSPRDLECVRDPDGELMERWALAEPFWHAARDTGYGRSLTLAARDLYGIDRIDADSLPELDRRFREARERGGHYRYVLKEKSRIRASVLDAGFPDILPDAEFFRPVARLDEFISPPYHQRVRDVEEMLDIRVHCLADWKEAMERQLDDYLERGAVAIKCGLAYQRPLRFEKTTAAEAEAGFQMLFHDESLASPGTPLRMPRATQDHLMHHLCALADERELTLQIHTGIQEGNGNFVTHSDPVLLTNLFCEYRRLRFDIFHMGYPYCHELGNLAKNFRHVFIDMCWAHIINPALCRRVLAEWLDAVPANKICGFGGDYCFVDGVYGHQYLARRNIASSLATKVDEGTMDLDRAREVAHWLLIATPARLFGIDPGSA